jgi:hypothetical protein
MASVPTAGHAVCVGWSRDVMCKLQEGDITLLISDTQAQPHPIAASKTLASGATDGCHHVYPGGRLDGSGYVPCSVQGNKWPRPRQLETETVQFGTRSTFPLQVAPYSNWLSSGLLSVGPCSGHGASIHAFRRLIRHA